MHVLLLGGSLQQPGGVEAFCDRSMEALKRRDSAWRIHRIATETAYLTVGRIPIVLAGLREVIRYRKLRPDVAWVQYVNLPDLAYVIVAKLCGMRVMVTPHLGSNWRSQSNPILRWISGTLLGLADRLALISKTQELEIALPANRPRSLIRNFLPETILTNTLPEEGARPQVMQLLHSARLSADKGTFMVVEVCAKLRDLKIPFVTRITGGADPETYAKLDALIAHHGLENQVLVLGRVTEEKLLETLRDSDVLIHLSRIDSYPLILLEAMASSMLPVAMELAGARDMIATYDGTVVSQLHPVEETVEFLVAAKLDDLRHRGRHQASRVRADYHWDRCAGALEIALRACATGATGVTAPG